MNGALAADDTLHLESLLLGALEIRAETIISFAAGLPGFPAMHRFALVDTQRADFVWMQSIDDASLTFLLADPFALVAGFDVELPAADLAALEASASPESLLLLAVVQLEGGHPVAANLQSPIVIDRDRRIGRQVVLADSRYGMHHPIHVD